MPPQLRCALLSVGGTIVIAAVTRQWWDAGYQDRAGALIGEAPVAFMAVATWAAIAGWVTRCRVWPWGLAVTGGSTVLAWYLFGAGAGGFISLWLPSLWLGLICVFVWYPIVLCAGIVVRKSMAKVTRR